MAVVAASADQLAAMRRDASDFQAYVLGPVTRSVLGRYAFCQSLEALRESIPANLLAEHDQANANAVTFARTVRGLNADALELAHHMDDEQGSVLTLGIVRKGAIPTTLSLWPIVPVIVIGAAAYGVWVLLDAWLSVRTLEAQNDALRAKTTAAVTAAIAAAPSPAAAEAMADALERANNAANNVQPGLLDKLAGAASEVGKSVRDSSALLLLVGAAWLWSRRKAAA